MVTKMKKEAASSKSASAQLGSIKESAQQIWLAGLGAFAKAQEEGSKVFDNLVKEGTSLQRKTQATAEERISEATSRMASMATDISAKASGQWDKLEGIFEERVAKEIDVLINRIDELNRSVAKLSAKASGTRAPAKRAAKTAVKRASSRK